MGLDKEIVVLTGGTGTVKLIKGLNKVAPENLTIVSNTGDDFIFYGLKVCPDTDSVLYSLSNQLDESKMWGIKNDSFDILSILKHIDTSIEPVANWFNLGDKDLAYCLYRTYLLNNGYSLADTINILRTKLSIKPLIFPMSNTEVTTYFRTLDGKLYHFAEFFIRIRSQEPIKEILYKKAGSAQVPKKLLEKISTAKLIILGPSNPITSIGPILGINKIKQAILKSKAKKIVISPIIGRDAYSGPAKIYMQAKNVEVSPVGIYSIYREIGDDFYFNESDEKEFGEILRKKSNNDGKNIYFSDIIFNNEEKQINFASKIIKELG